MIEKFNSYKASMSNSELEMAIEIEKAAISEIRKLNQQQTAEFWKAVENKVKFEGELRHRKLNARAETNKVG